MWRQVGFRWLALSLPIRAWKVWADGVYIPKNSEWTLWKATWRARRAELLRMVTTYQSTWAAAHVRTRDGERLILAASVIFHEQRPTRRLFPSTQARSRRVWLPRDRTQHPVIITAVDRGILGLTNKRFIYESQRKRRDFPIHDLVHVSTTSDGIALATRGHRGIAYFTGLDALWISFTVAPGTEDRWKAQLIESRLNGDDLEHMVRLLKRPTTSALT